MNKIKSIKFINHPILKDLFLDFCDRNGNPVDTVIFAGENGTGKSTILDCLYKIIISKMDYTAQVVFDNNGRDIPIKYDYINVNNQKFLYAFIGQEQCHPSTICNKYKLNAMYSDVDINFHSQEVSTVTSLELDNSAESRKSNSNIAKDIKQLLIDIHTLDASDFMKTFEIARKKGEDLNTLLVEKRMHRFTRAFDRIFDALEFKDVINNGKNKEILFVKNGQDISIESLSSGEKQIVYRGCFLLKDAEAMNGAFVFIDEPEISLHPIWQSKIMDYYKEIFTNDLGNQTSQIFAVTHSPFIIHNENRKNDKVIVLSRDDDGNIVVKDKAEYYKCDSFEVVQDAFSVNEFSKDKSIVYLEGRTDEKYFNKALEVFDLKVPFEFKWVGYLDENGQEVNTGDKCVDKAFHFLVSQDLQLINICLKDGDTNCQTKRTGNVFITSIPKYDNSKGMKKGIENALILDDIDLTSFYTEKEKKGEYGNKTTIEEFDKMGCCDALCAMEQEVLRKVFQNLKDVICELTVLFNEGKH